MARNGQQSDFGCEEGETPPPFPQNRAFLPAASLQPVPEMKSNHAELPTDPNPPLRSNPALRLPIIGPDLGRSRGDLEDVSGQGGLYQEVRTCQDERLTWRGKDDETGRGMGAGGMSFDRAVKDSDAMLAHPPPSGDFEESAGRFASR